MLGFRYTTRIDYPAYYFARQGMWPLVYRKLEAQPALLNAVDHLEACIGWTWLDHALHQGRLDVIQTLQATFGLQKFSNKASIIVYHAQLQNWLWIQQLLNAKLIRINDEYYGQDGKTYTLLDIAYLQHNKNVIVTLRQKYGAMIMQERDIATEQMFTAAKIANWQIVYQLLDEQQVLIDNIDRHDPQGRVLLHFAYEQRNQTVFLKLLDHYGASLDEIRNEDPLLYDLMVDFYDLSRIETESIIDAFSQCSLMPPPIARPILPGYSKARQATEIVNVENLGLERLRGDYPNDEDEIIPFTRKM